MHWTTDAWVTALGRTTLMVAVSAVLVGLLVAWLRIRSTAVQRLAWTIVLLQGCLLAQVPIVVQQTALAPAEANLPVLGATAVDMPSTLLEAVPTPSDRRETVIAQTPPVHGETSALSSATPATLATETKATVDPIPWRLVLLAIWMIGAVLVPIVCARRYVSFLNRLRTTDEPRPEWREEFEQVRAEFAKPGYIILRIGEDVGPCLVRRWRGSWIVVPQSLWRTLEPHQRRSVLRHELAHHARGDLWKSIVVRLLAAPQWFNPVAWWAVRRFDECAEWACDELAAGGASTTEYSRLLLSLGTENAPRATYLPAARRGSVSTRIRRLLAAPGRDSRCVCCAIPLCAAALLAVNLLRIEVVARTPPAKPAATAVSPTPGTPRRMPWHPDDLVAVLGDERGKLWSHAGHLLLTPDGRRLIADAGHNSLFIYDADTLDVLATFGDRPSRLMSAALSQEGSRLIAGYADGSMTLWNIVGDEPQLEQTVNVMPADLEQPYLHYVHALRADRVAITARNRLMLWELDGNQLRSVSLVECEKDLYRPAISPDGRSIVTTISVQPAAGDRIIEFDGRRFSLPDSQLQLWDVSGPNLREVSRLTTDLLESIIFSPDGRMLIGHSNVEGRHIATRGVPVVAGQLVEPHDLPIRLASSATPAFSQDGKLMAVMNDSRELQVVDISRDAWRIVATLETGPGFYPGVAFRPEGESLYVPIGCCLQRWDRTAEGGYYRVNAPEAHSSSIGDIVFASGDVLISTGREAICEWDLRRLESPQPIIHKAPQIPSGSQRLVAWPERDAVLFQSWASRNAIHLWDRTTGAVSDTCQLDFGDNYRNAAWCLALQPGGRLLATGHWDSALRFWDLRGAAPAKVAELQNAHRGHVCNVTFSPDGRMLASVGWDHTVKLWDMSTDPPSPGGELGMHDDIVRSVAFSPDGRWLASGDEKGVIRLWDLNSDDRSGPTIRHPEDLARVASPYDEQRTMNTLEFSADGRRLLSADGGGRVTVWTVPTGEIVKRWTFPGWVWAARWSPDQQLIATANQNGTMYLLVAPQP